MAEEKEVKNAFLLTFFALFLMVNLGYAAEVCFKDPAEFQAIRAQLPEVLQKFPVRLEQKNMLVSAVAQLQFSGDHLRFFFNCTREIKKPVDLQALKICSTDLKMKIYFYDDEEKKERFEEIDIKGPLTIKVRSKLDLSISESKESFEALSEAIIFKTGVPVQSRSGETTKGNTQ